MGTRVQPQDGFQEFWNSYPRRIGKIAAQKAYAKAVTTHGATLPELLEGIRRYIAGKPAYADYAHPTTWLNQGRWMDQYDEPPAVAIDWWEECKALHGGRCTKRWDHCMLKREQAG